jgi:hypothetical protein
MHCMVELFASNSHSELEMQINTWLRSKKPSRILDVSFVADGAEFTYCVMIMFVPKEKPLPK